MMNGETPERTDTPRARVLQAASRLFSELGFDAASLQQIADAAGVARATPSYFFGSKEGLWKAVLDEQSRAAATVLPTALDRLGAQSTRRDLLEALVDGVFEFQASHEAFFRLLQWSRLQGNRFIDASSAHQQAIDVALDAVGSVLNPAGEPWQRQDLAQMLLSVIGLCAAHLTFGETLGTPLGVDMRDGTFLERRRAHIKRLLGAVLLE